MSYYEEDESYLREQRSTHLMWTVCGDFQEELEEEEKKYITDHVALYAGLIAGGRRIYLDWPLLEQFILEKRNAGYHVTKMTELLGLMVYPYIGKKLTDERPGVIDLQIMAAQDLYEHLSDDYNAWPLEKQLFKTMAGLDPTPSDTVKKILSAAEAETTKDLLALVESLYLDCYGPPKGPAPSRQSEVSIEKTLERFYKRHGEKDLAEELEEQQESTVDVAASGEIHVDRFANVKEQISFFKGKSALPDDVILARERALCRGIHRGYLMHVTKGVLRSGTDAEKRIQYATKQKEKNLEAFLAKETVYRETIHRTRDVILRNLIRAKQEDLVPADVGIFNARKAWRVGRTEPRKMFVRKQKEWEGDFVIYLLLDGSASQQYREAMVSTQAYILAAALVSAGLPTRVASFNNMLQVTVFTQYRDFDDPIKETEHIFEYQCEGSNRDGLAIKAAVDSLMKRKEDNKLLVVLSDGIPNDAQIVSKIGPKQRRHGLYSGYHGVADTATEVRKARKAGVYVLGVFTGKEADLETEQRIYGKDFVYTKNPVHFAHIVSTYIKRIITSD
ncbi:MAG: hypothetical protein GX127_07520 [Eubacteriaceae bacterium]|jgi:hypothetical protein|nr:hypothetical protein [Eubacteriaceae bacterium]